MGTLPGIVNGGQTFPSERPPPARPVATQISAVRQAAAAATPPSLTAGGRAAQARPMLTQGFLCRRGMIWLAWLGLAAISLQPMSAPAARPWPDTRFRIVPFADQLPGSLTDTQRWFAATHFAGTQKQLRSQVRALRAYNPDFLCLHYQLAVGCGPAAFIDGDAWVSDWTYVNQQTNWFLRNPSGQRVHQPEWNWDLMDVRYTNGVPLTGFPDYWLTTCLARMRAAEDDGVFADSYTPDAYGFGLSSPSHPWLDDVNLCLANWVPALERFGTAVRQTLEAPTNDFVFLPNLGGLVTSWLNMNYAVGHGGMIEGFAFWGPGNYFDPADWALQMDRALALTRSNRILICQSYPAQGSATERLFATASYLLIKGQATYLNLLASDAVALEYYPEYTLDLGGARTPVATGIASLWHAGWGVYRRDYTNGLVLVNPGAAAVNITNLGGTHWRVTTSGGGLVNASGNYGGTVTLSAITNLTLPARTAAILMFTNGTPTNASPAQPTNLRAFHRSGQTFLTWTESAALSGESYRIYRSAEPITAANLASATRLYEVWEDSASFHGNRFRDDNTGLWSTRYFDRVVITNGGSQLPAGTGLLVWTLATNDFAGGDSGTGYYAVTTVNADGVENRAALGVTNTVGPLGESVAEPLPVEAAANVGPRGHLYLQFMDLRRWNPTFHAPQPGNGFYGLNASLPAVRHALAYVYDYVVFEPECSTGVVPVFFSLHGWGDDGYRPVTSDPDPWGWCAYKIYPRDQSETWWFGFARDHDFRAGGAIAAGDAVANFTEQRLLWMLRGLIRQPPAAATVDTNRIYVYGQSMGGSGTLALALRYPNVFAAAYASQPMTDYATAGDGGGLDWRSDVEPKWGLRSLGLPVVLDAPAGWAAPLQRYNGTNVWVWQNHRFNLTNRLADEMVPFGVGHGTNDMTIEWPTQARPFYSALEAARRAYGGAVVTAGHTWLGFNGLPPALATDSSLAPFRAFQVVRDETVPGLAHATGNGPLPPVAPAGYNLNLDWSSRWRAWDGEPLDTTNVWQMSLRSLSGTQTVDVTPRRTRLFRSAPGTGVTWRNQRVSDGVTTQTGTATADGWGLVTVSNVTVTTTGNRLRLELVPEAPVVITGAQLTGSDFRLSFTTSAGRAYTVERSPVLPAAVWTVVATNLAGNGGTTNFTHAGALTNSAGFYRVRRQ